ncbi:MAG: TerB family tellurite resistance protein [Elainellaceae cyanobacterium]
MVQQTPPPPPSITPRQMNLLRIVAYMAWSDGGLAEEEAGVMLSRFSGVFAKDEAQAADLQRELRAYLMQKIPLEELVPKLQTHEERKFVLRLGYEVIRANTRSPGEAAINDDEAAAYNTLKDLISLPEEEVQQIQAEVEAEGHQPDEMVGTLTQELRNFAGS